MLDQHAVTLNSLSMEQDPSHISQLLGETSHMPAGAWPPSWYMAPDVVANIHDLETTQNGNATEDYLNQLNRDRFLSIHSFYRHMVDHTKHPHVDLDLTETPRLVTREDLKGDECDMQGIDWSMRRRTRAAIRAQRTEFEAARLSPLLKSVRQVGHGTFIHLGLG
jgi:hypothetical protein